MKPKKPTRGKPKKPPTREVNRKRLLALIKRYRKYLAKQVKYLKGLDGATVELRVERDDEAAETGGGRAQVLSARHKDPGELENSCIYYAGPTGTETEMIDTVTPYTRALTNDVKED